MPTTSSGQHLLLPDRSLSSRKHQTILVEVSSRDRNLNSLIPSNPFRFTFPRPLKDVQSVELLSGTIPANPYTIVHGRNSFSFQEGSTLFSISIPPGSYTNAFLLATLNTLFTSLSTTNTYSWSQTSNGSSLLTRTSGTLPFSLLFASGSPSDIIDRVNGSLQEINTPASILGFDFADYSNTSTTIESPFPIDVHSVTNRLYLYLNFENSQNLSAIERGSGKKPPFAIIYLDEQTNGYKYLNKDTLTPAS